MSKINSFIMELHEQQNTMFLYHMKFPEESNVILTEDEENDEIQSNHQGCGQFDFCSVYRDVQ
jgi:hypothetical protein